MSDDLESKCRIVDGVSSSKTYIVIATRETDRVAIRFLGIKNFPEMDRKGNPKPDGKLTLGTWWKVHIERDSRKRYDVSDRTFARFGLPDVFWHKGTRFTGTLWVPFAYMPNRAERLQQNLEEADTATALWEAILFPAKENGAEPDTDKRTFNKWILAQLKDIPFEHIGADTATRSAPVVKAWWDDLSAYNKAYPASPSEPADDNNDDE